MMTHAITKDLPRPVEDELLPPLPPPKIVQEDDGELPVKSRPQLSNIALLPPLSDFKSPHTPTSPNSLISPSVPPSPAPDGKLRRSNPLTDLIDTEKAYVDQLAGVIRKVAAAWSRSNLPPPELDTMFRAVEAIYKANRTLLSKLKEIGTSPSSPKALGDLLMRWIDDLEGPYTSYSTKYISGFDEWEPVVQNPRLPNILALFSSSNPPLIISPADPQLSAPHLWTLDLLFLLPHGRLKYYKKLYSRLLKSTAPGRSDYNLLVGAVEKLDGLLTTVESRSEIKIISQIATVSPANGVQDDVVIDTSAQPNDAPLPPPPSDFKESSSGSESRHPSSSSGERFSQETTPAPRDQGSTSTLSSISDLERRLSTAKTLDLFTMKPREVKLQIITPGLTYTRELRLSVDVVITFTPKSTGTEISYQRGHIFLLTDLFLIAERMLPSERAMNGPDGADMTLLFPPLAGKHLRVSEAPGIYNALTLTILRKETMTLTTSSPGLRRKLLEEFRDCIDSAASTHSRVKQDPPPPMPPLNHMPRSSSSPLPAPSSPPSEFARTSGSSTKLSPPTRSFSPGSERSLPQRPDSSTSDRRWSPSALPGDSTNRLVLSPDVQVQHVSQRVPSLQEPLPGPLSAMRTSSTAETILDPMTERWESDNHPPSSFSQRHGGPLRPGSGGSSFQPGQIVTSQSFTPGQVLPPTRNASILNQGPGVPQGVLQRGASGQFGSIPGQHPAPYRGPPPGHYAGPPQMQGYGPGVLSHQHPPYGGPHRPPSELSSFPQNGYQGLRKSQSSYSITSNYDHPGPSRLPPVPGLPGGYPAQTGYARNNSFGDLHAPQPRPLLPSAQMSVRSMSMSGPTSFHDPSPPGSPVLESSVGPVTSSISAQMKCKVFLKQQHAQWKSLGAARLKLYRESPTNVKQLVVEADNKAKTILISTIVLTDGVERVGKTGVAVELSDKGARTGIVYMIQLRNESSAGGLFDSLLAGSDRS